MEMLRSFRDEHMMLKAIYIYVYISKPLDVVVNVYNSAASCLHQERTNTAIQLTQYFSPSHTTKFTSMYIYI